MPYSIEEGRADCSGYAVTKDADGELMGCHRTRSQAEAQLTALNIAEAENRDAVHNADTVPEAPLEQLATPNADAARAIVAELATRRLK